MVGCNYKLEYVDNIYRKCNIVATLKIINMINIITSVV